MYRIPSRKDRLRQMGCSRTLGHRAARPPEFGDVYPVSGPFLHTNFWSRTLAREAGIAKGEACRLNLSIDGRGENQAGC